MVHQSETSSNASVCPSSNALENVYSMIQHPKEAARPESAVPGANGSVVSPPGPGVRAASPPCLIQRQVGTPETRIWDKRFLSTHTVGATEIVLNLKLEFKDTTEARTRDNLSFPLLIG